MNKDEIVIKIESSIKEIADQFTINRDKAFYFRNESDIKCRLFACISKNIGDTELVHAEQRIEKTRSWHDLVIWKPEMKATAASKWGKYNSDFANSLPDLNLVVIEIKHLYGGIEKVKKYMNCKSICAQPDVKNLIKQIKKHCQHVYFIMFWDEDVKNKEKCSKYYDKLEKAFIKFRKKYSRIRILCKTRDGLQFTLGF